MSNGSKMPRRDHEEWLEANSWDPIRNTDLVVESDLRPAAWLEPALSPGTHQVRMTAPQGYEAYARILFPFHTESALDGQDQSEKFTSWHELAARNGRTVHPLMERDAIDIGTDDWPDYRLFRNEWGERAGLSS
jgi:hypothetical protein